MLQIGCDVVAGLHAELLLPILQHEKFQSEPGSRVGTPAYLAPEVILTTRGKTYDGKVHVLVSLEGWFNLAFLPILVTTAVSKIALCER